MSREEFMKLPYGYVKKYGSYLNFIKRMQYEGRIRENREYRGYYDQIKNLDKLMTDE